MARSKALERPPRGHGRLIAGVCGGVAHRFGISVTFVRIVFLVAGLVGAGEVVYLILWLLMPNSRR